MTIFERSSGASPTESTGRNFTRRSAPDHLWSALLVGVALASAGFAWLANYPGRMSADSYYQLQQALGEIPLDDWHPPAMTVSWQILHDLTGSVSSLLAVQLTVIFGATLLFSLFIHRTAQNRVLSLSAVSFPLLPYIFTFAGVFWKDVQMMAALFAGFVMILVYEQRSRRRAMFFLLALAFFLYAALIRQNGIVAVLPVVLLLYRAWRDHSDRPQASSSKQRKSPFGYIQAALAFIALALGAGALFDAVFEPVEMGVSQIYLDDILYLLTPGEITASDAPPVLKLRLLEAQEKCSEAGIVVDALTRCYYREEGESPFRIIEFQQPLKDLWTAEIASRPSRYLDYLAYHSRVFALFLFDGNAPFLDSNLHNRIVPDEYESLNKDADAILEAYVTGAGVRSFPWLFSAWFWLLGACIVGSCSTRSRRFRPHISALVTSAALYILAYLVYVPAQNYRYAYWSAFAVTTAFVLLLTDFFLGRTPKED